MSLLSSNKVSMFNDSLLALMKMMIDQGWNNRNETSDYGSFLIDNMQFTLNPSKKPYEDLIQAFSKHNNNDNLTEYQQSSTQINFMRQRRVMITPTLIRFSTAQEEQTNRVIRQYNSFIPNFIRLSFMTEDLDKGYYFGGMSENYLLGFIHGVISNGFKLGDMAFQFLGYSNSQLKSHSCWFLCINNPLAHISTAEIETFMGNFDKEKNVLKKYARKG